mmetsp:Transcript_1733/g.3838  ORF Transcript_1733/g.3838 Transcript_1733/m.3838 type:complete len:217 (+) Transcript_1733:93-743(+)
MRPRRASARLKVLWAHGSGESASAHAGLRGRARHLVRKLERCPSLCLHPSGPAEAARLQNRHPLKPHRCSYDDPPLEAEPGRTIPRANSRPSGPQQTIRAALCWEPPIPALKRLVARRCSPAVDPALGLSPCNNCPPGPRPRTPKTGAHEGAGPGRSGWSEVVAPGGARDLSGVAISVGLGKGGLRSCATNFRPLGTDLGVQIHNLNHSDHKRDGP